VPLLHHKKLILLLSITLSDKFEFFFRPQTKLDHYTFFVIKNESTNEIALLRHIFEKIGLKCTENGFFELK